MDRRPAKDPGACRKWLALRCLPGLVAALTAAPSVADAIRVGVGHGQSTDDYGISVQIDRLAPVHEWAAWTLTSHAEFGGGEFQGHRGSISHDTVHALAAVWKLRWQRAPAHGLQPFVDLGVGLGGLSEVTINGDRDFTTAFQFTELLRTGVRFGGRLQYEATVGAQHFSNAGLRRPNDGITYAGATVAWYWH